MPPQVSVVIPAYNAAALLPLAVESVRRQTFTDLEIIVVDDGSTDETGALAERLTRDGSGGGPDYVVIHQENRGAAAARNAGLRVARGQYVAFLDADDLWHARFAERSVGALWARQDVDMTYSGYRMVDEHGDDTGNVWEGTAATLGAEDLLRFNPIHTSSAMVRRATLERLGGFEQLRNFEDLDLWLRIALLRPGNLLCITDVLTDYRIHPSQLTADWRRKSESWEILLARWRRHHPDLVLPIEREIKARSRLHLAQNAYKVGDYGAARRLTLEAWRRAADKLVIDPSLWRQAAQYVLLSALPDAWHGRIAVAARAARARKAAAPRLPTVPGSP